MGQLTLGDVCRVKGQETNTLQGWGLVTGLRGTGDSDSTATSLALSRMIQLMGGPIGLERNGQLDTKALGETKNVAMVFVTAQVPRFGALQGDLVDVTVTAISAKEPRGWCAHVDASARTKSRQSDRLRHAGRIASFSEWSHHQSHHRKWGKDGGDCENQV